MRHKSLLCNLLALAACTGQPGDDAARKRAPDRFALRCTGLWQGDEQMAPKRESVVWIIDAGARTVRMWAFGRESPPCSPDGHCSVSITPNQIERREVNGNVDERVFFDRRTGRLLTTAHHHSADPPYTSTFEGSCVPASLPDPARPKF